MNLFPSLLACRCDVTSCLSFCLDLLSTMDYNPELSTKQTLCCLSCFWSQYLNTVTEIKVEQGVYRNRETGVC